MTNYVLTDILKLLSIRKKMMTKICFRVETGSDGTAQLPEFVLKKSKTFEYSTDSLSSSLDESLNQVSTKVIMKSRFGPDTVLAGYRIPG